MCISCSFLLTILSCSAIYIPSTTGFVQPLVVITNLLMKLCSLLIRYCILDTNAYNFLSSENNTLCKCCRLSHFDYVKSEDLERIGMGKPAIRRLVDAVKKRNRKKGLFEKVALLLVILQMWFSLNHTLFHTLTLLDKSLTGKCILSVKLTPVIPKRFCFGNPAQPEEK